MSAVSTTVTDLSARRRTARITPDLLATVAQIGPSLLAAEKAAEKGYEDGAAFVAQAMKVRREGKMDLTLGLEELDLVHQGMGHMLAARALYLRAHKSGAGTLVPGMYGPDCPCEQYPNEPQGTLGAATPPDGPVQS